VEILTSQMVLRLGEAEAVIEKIKAERRKSLEERKDSESWPPGSEKWLEYYERGWKMMQEDPTKVGRMWVKANGEREFVF
jgi:hypothetical protein